MADFIYRTLVCVGAIKPPSPPLLPMLPDDEDDQDDVDEVLAAVPTTSSPPAPALHTMAVDFHSELTRSDAACMPADSGMQHAGDMEVSSLNVHQWLQTHCHTVAADDLADAATRSSDGTTGVGGGDTTFNVSSVTGDAGFSFTQSSNTEAATKQHETIVLSSDTSECSVSTSSGEVASSRGAASHLSPIHEDPAPRGKPPPGPSRRRVARLASSNSTKPDR